MCSRWMVFFNHKNWDPGSTSTTENNKSEERSQSNTNNGVSVSLLQNSSHAYGVQQMGCSLVCNKIIVEVMLVYVLM